jgi:hypothetical protein
MELERKPAVNLAPCSNGDSFTPARHVMLRPGTYTMPSFLDDICRQMQPFNGIIERLYKLDGTPINAIGELVAGESYVALHFFFFYCRGTGDVADDGFIPPPPLVADGSSYVAGRRQERFRLLDYKKIGVPVPVHVPAKAPPRIVKSARYVRADPSYVSTTITIMPNEDPFSTGLKVSQPVLIYFNTRLLNNLTTSSFKVPLNSRVGTSIDSLLDLISSRIKLRTGAARKLCVSYSYLYVIPC